MTNFHRALIAGTHSGVGKTTWSLALMAYFQKKGFTVQPFKVGPDYIDPGFHHLACSPRKSRNLDRFFLSEDYLRRCFERNSDGADLALIEGVMGLFDGRGPLSEEGSTAEMAKLLGLPVFLVIDGSGLARSAAALVKGYQIFDPGLSLRGVLLNGIGSEGHFKWLKEAIEKETGLPVLGWLPRDPGVSIPERHLGLRTAPEEGSVQEKLNQLAQLLSGRFDEKHFLELSVTAKNPGFKANSGPRDDTNQKCRIAVAYDRAFSFYYEDNFDLLRDAGAELTFFSPLADAKIPEGTDLVYLGGGFPEIYAGALSENESMKTSVRQFHQEGGILYSECGGLIYLCEYFVDGEGRKFPLVGLVPGRVRMTDRLQHFGYHELECAVSTFLCPEGKKLRSHEFHYSIWEVEAAPASPFQQPYQIGGRPEGFYQEDLLASYQHLHWGQDPELVQNLVRAAGEAHKRRKYVPDGSNV